MRRTWRFRPSVSVTSSHAVGTRLRERIGTARGGSYGDRRRTVGGVRRPGTASAMSAAPG